MNIEEGCATMKKLHTINNLGYLPETDMYGRYIWTAIREGLWPFRPQTVSLFLDVDVDRNLYVLFVKVWFPDFLLCERVEMDAWGFKTNREGTVLKAASEMLWKLRNREDHLLAPLIQLGEN